MLKFATFEITSSLLVPRNLSGRGLRRWAHRHNFDYEPRPGFLYVRSRAISSRCNDNFDEFPAEEIEKAYRTFVGKPVFVNHHNDNHRRARGVVIDAVLHKDALPDGAPDTWVEVLMEVDAVKFPKLAQAIIAGHIDRTSMGTDVAYSLCSVCGNKATTPAEYCQHIPKMKGQRIYRTTASGRKEGILVREKCYGLKFFENSLLVEEPADPTAFTFGVDTRGLSANAAREQGAKMAVREGLGVTASYPLECYACGESGDAGHFLGTGQRRCPNCKSYEVHDPHVGKPNPDWTYTPGAPQGLSEEQRRDLAGIGTSEEQAFLKSNPTGPTKFSTFQNVEDFFATAHYDPDNDHYHRDGDNVVALPPRHQTIPLSEHDRALIDAASQAGEDYANVWEQAQKRKTDLGDPEATRQHMMDAHGFEPGDFWRNTHGEYHPALNGGKPQSLDDDRPLTHKEVRALHDFDHSPDGMGGDDSPHAVTLNNIHRHEARRRVAHTHTAEKVVHFRDASGTVACNPGRQWDSTVLSSTHGTKKVTCPNCLRSRAYADAKSAPKTATTFEDHFNEQMKGSDFERAHKQQAGEELGKSLWEGFANAMGFADSEHMRTHRQNRDMETLHERYKGQPGSFHFDSAEEPYYRIDHPSGWEGRMNVGPYMEVSHKATGDSVHELVDLGHHPKYDGPSREDGAYDRHSSEDESKSFVEHWAGRQGHKMGPWKRNDSGSLSAHCTDCGRSAGVSKEPDGYLNYGSVTAAPCGEGHSLHPSLKTDDPATNHQRAAEHLDAFVKETGHENAGNYDPRIERWNKRKGITGAKVTKTATRKVGYGEIKAPADVDTLRDEECPVCGEKDAFDGNECQVCGYVAPPEMFTDPDLDLASQIDLRKDVADDAASDPNNDGMPDKGLDPEQKMQYPTAPGDMGEQADPNAPEVGGSLPIDPNSLPDPDNPAAPATDAFGNPLAPATTVDPNGQPVMQQQLGPLDPALQGAQDIDNDGTVDVSIPQSDTTAPDGQVYEAPQNDPASLLSCPACGFQAPAAPPQSVDMQQEAVDPMGLDSSDGLVEGDVCPNCGGATLMTQGDAEQGLGQPLAALSPVPSGDSPTKGREATRAAKHGEGADVTMSRPVLAAVQAQQKIIDQQNKTIERLRREAVVAKSQLHYLARIAGVSDEFDAIRKRADALNPASPVPDPPSEAPFETTEQALQADTNDNVQNIGQTPGSVNDLAADTTTNPLVPGETLPVDPFNNLQDVTAPVAGTETHVPNDQTRIETDVRVGNPNNPETAFPWGLGDGQRSANRTMASLRLARLRIAAGTAESDDDLAVCAAIENSDISDETIAHEISTLSAVTKAARRQGRPTNAVPKVAQNVQRTVPSLSPEAVPMSVTAGLGPDVDDADLFLGDFE